jgi:hypothetical protein
LNRLVIASTEVSGNLVEIGLEAVEGGTTLSVSTDLGPGDLHGPRIERTPA